MGPADVLIVGGGPAGSALAIRLAQAGVAVTVIDRARFPRDKACSEYMSPEAVRQLDLLGALAPVERLGGHRLRGTAVTAARGARLLGLFAEAGVPPFRATGLSIPRLLLDQALLELARAAGAVIRDDTTAVAVRPGAGAQLPVVELTHPDEGRTSLAARVIVGADGLRSVVRRALGGAAEPWLERLAFVAHVDEVDGLSDVAEMHVAADGYAGLNPLGGGRANVAMVVPKSRATAARGRPEAFWHDCLEALPGVRGRVRRDRIARPVMVTGPFATRAREVVGHGLLLVGDAAEFFDPFTGEGICTALRGAELAATTLLEVLRSPAPIDRGALAPYRAARRRVFRGKWAVERMIGYGMLAPLLFDRAVGRLERRGLAHTLIGVTGDFVPARAVLNPRFLGAMLL